MTTLITKIASATSTVALFAIGSAMAVLGLAVLGMLALFALISIGFAVLAAPLLRMVQPAAPENNTVSGVA